MKHFFSVIILFALLFAGCDSDEQCRTNDYIMFRVGLYQSVTDTLGMQKNIPYKYRVWVQGEGIDSVLYNKELASVDLPLNKLDAVSRFNISFNDTLTLLTVYHTNNQQYISFECGCRVTYLVDSVRIEGDFIDSLSFKNNEVNTQNVENIQLYRHYYNH